MGGGMEVDLTHGAVAAMSRLAEGLRPVLQVAGVQRMAGAATERYRILLSDGVHSQEGMLATSMNRLVTAGLLRRGSVVRVLDYVCNSVQDRRVIIVIQLKILKTECTLIGSPTIYEVNATQPNIGSYSGGLGGIRGPCMISRAEQGVNNISCYPVQGLLGSSIAPRVEHAVNNLPFVGQATPTSPNYWTVALMASMLNVTHRLYRSASYDRDLYHRRLCAALDFIHDVMDPRLVPMDLLEPRPHGVDRPDFFQFSTVCSHRSASRHQVGMAVPGTFRGRCEPLPGETFRLFDEPRPIPPHDVLFSNIHADLDDYSPVF